MSESISSTQSLPAGTRIEEFVIERVLGTGGFGVTYLARDTSLDRQVVIKENLPVQFCFRDTHSLTVAPRHTHGDDLENFRWSLENFSKEAAMLASLDHSGIVKVLRRFEAFGTAYFVMPFVNGETFDEQVRKSHDKPFTEDELRGLLDRVLSALDHIHQRGIYHRDIKPGNILITHDGIPLLIDFGSARQRISERSMTVVESAGYTPFEQLQSRGNVGPWSDLYALGATLAKAITGETPPKAADRAFDDPFVPLAERPELNAAYSSSFLHSVDRALAMKPTDRWQYADEWLADISRPSSQQNSVRLLTTGTEPETESVGSALSSSAITCGNYSAAFIRKQRQRLLDLRDVLLGCMSGRAVDSDFESPAGYEEPDSDHCIGVTDNDAYDRDFALSVLAKEYDALHEIQQALQRIEDGTYGICQISSVKIPQARLEAIPFARLTVDSQTQWEKENGKRRFWLPHEIGFGAGYQTDDHSK